MLFCLQFASKSKILDGPPIPFHSHGERIFKCLHLVKLVTKAVLVIPLPMGKTINDFLKSAVKSFSLFLSPLLSG